MANGSIRRSVERKLGRLRGSIYAPRSAADEARYVKREIARRVKKATEDAQ